MNEKKKRIVMTVVGVLVCGFSAGMFDFSDFGMDPFQVFAHGVGAHVSIGFGTLYMILNLAMLVGVFFVDKRKIGLGTLINIFVLGYVVQFSSWFWKMVFPDPSILIKGIMLIAGIVIMCLASALYFTGDLGVSTYDAVALILSAKTKWKFRFCRIGTDLLCVAIGFVLGATVGVGTLVTAFFMGPLIDFFNRTVAVPLLRGKQERKG